MEMQRWSIWVRVTTGVTCHYFSHEDAVIYLAEKVALNWWNHRGREDLVNAGCSAENLEHISQTIQNARNLFLRALDRCQWQNWWGLRFKYKSSDIRDLTVWVLRHIQEEYLDWPVKFTWLLISTSSSFLGHLIHQFDNHTLLHYAEPEAIPLSATCMCTRHEMTNRVDVVSQESHIQDWSRSAREFTPQNEVVPGTVTDTWKVNWRKEVYQGAPSHRKD